ncbi:DUF5906 domain-containing protein [Hymenobacter puniceus]|uniref:DUF5906 domain-containing protein n=1 Tax=Hymenobacter sp. BT190 TaxID=2763505 RepID=UPI0016515460|nr:DUF5906 domain-containing protein [Hymenobacter sp. BT190]MBC6698061.1 hypothetical protein [Hymenobacter sp. BT190]
MSTESTIPSTPDPVPADQPAPQSYALRRIQEIGMTPEQNHFYGYDPTSNDSHRKRSFKVFSADKDDNLQILYPMLSGEVEVYDNGTKNNPHSIFYRIRLKEPRTYTDKDGNLQTQKYDQVRGTPARPFYPPGIVEKFIAGTKIKTLYFVEGELKAFSGYVRGLDIVGLPGNTLLKEKGTGDIRLEGSLVGLIRKCQVEEVILLHDADALTVTWAKDKDLGKRPGSFAAAVISSREALQPLLDDKDCTLERVFYMHGKRDFCEKGAKGLDDLLISHPDHHKEILEDLGKHETANTYFLGKNITTPHYDRIREYFGVGRKAGNEQTFYDLYKPYIGNREFVLWKRRYQHNGEAVQYLAHQESGKYARVGSDWYKWVQQPNADGDPITTLKNAKVGEIQRDFKKFPNFLDECPKYDGFTVMPNFNGEYQPVIHGHLNLITPLAHDPKPGDFPNTRAFLKHIFGGKGTFEEGIQADPFTVALDWLTVCHNHPTHQLPVIILVSKENKTGKTTFLNWMNWIYGDNATVLNNDQFKMKFNAHYASKFIIGLDEAFQDLEKKAEKERLKQMVTSKEMFIERKGVDLQRVPFYGKLLMTSNDEDKVMKIDDGETRWFVIKVPQFTKEDVDMEKKLKDEIPAWLDYLHHRKPFHERESRLWFKPEDFITDQFTKIVESTKNRLDKSVETFIKEMFMTYRLEKLKLPLKWLVQQLNDMSKYRMDEQDVRNFLKEKRGMEPEKQPQRVKVPIAINPDNLDTQGRPHIDEYYTAVARPYVFSVLQWLSDSELEEWNAPLPTPEPAAAASAKAAEVRDEKAF